MFFTTDNSINFSAYEQYIYKFVHKIQQKEWINLSSLSEIIGERIKYFRKQKNISQERLSELSELHPTYIGQLERGEKNPSMDTIYKICCGLDIPVSYILEKIDEYQLNNYSHVTAMPEEDNIPLKAYEIIYKEPKEKQKLLYELLMITTQYNND